MLKKVLAKLGRVLIKTGTHLLHLSRPRLAVQQPDFISRENKKGFFESKTYSGKVDGKL